MATTSTRRAITILGVGHIGFAMALLLQHTRDYDIPVDRDQRARRGWPPWGVSTQRPRMRPACRPPSAAALPVNALAFPPRRAGGNAFAPCRGALL